MNLERLQGQARDAAAVQTDMTTAIAEERAAQGRALEALVQAVLPALPALVTPMVIDLRTHKLLDADGQVLGAMSGRFYRLGSAGQALYLDAVGQLWWANLTTQKWEVVSPFHAGHVAVWPVEAWAGQLGLSCEAAANGRASKGAAKARQRAARLLAVATLLAAIGES